MGKKGKGKGKGKKGKDKGDFTEALELPEFAEDFACKSSFNAIKHKFMDQIHGTNAQLWLRDADHGAPTHIDVTAHSQEDLDAAVTIAQEILDELAVTYDNWVADGSPDAAPREGKGKGKKGKAKKKKKRKDKGDDTEHEFK